MATAQLTPVEPSTQVDQESRSEATDADTKPQQNVSDELIPPAGWQAPLLDLLAAMARRWYVVIGMIALGVGLGAYKYVKTAPYYRSTAQAVLMPREKPHLDIMVNTSSVKTTDSAAKRETTGALMLPPNTELYTALLHSRAVLLRVAAKYFDALDLSLADRSDELVEEIRGMMKVVASEEGMMTIEITADDPSTAANIANELIVEMENASKQIERQLVLQQAGFLDEAIADLQKSLNQSESKLEMFLRRVGIVDVGQQVAEVLKSIRESEAALRNMYDERTEALESYDATHSLVQALDARIKLKRNVIDELRSSYFGAFNEREFGEIQLEHETLTDDLRRQRDMLATLTTQQKVFQIRAEQPAGSVAVVSPARPELMRAGPSKGSMIGVAFVLSLILAVVGTLLLEQWDGVRKDPYLGVRIREVRSKLLFFNVFRKRERIEDAIEEELEDELDEDFDFDDLASDTFSNGFVDDPVNDSVDEPTVMLPVVAEATRLLRPLDIAPERDVTPPILWPWRIRLGAADVDHLRRDSTSGPLRTFGGADRGRPRQTALREWDWWTPIDGTTKAQRVWPAGARLGPTRGRRTLGWRDQNLRSTSARNVPVLREEPWLFGNTSDNRSFASRRGAWLHQATQPHERLRAPIPGTRSARQVCGASPTAAEARLEAPLRAADSYRSARQIRAAGVGVETSSRCGGSRRAVWHAESAAPQRPTSHGIRIDSTARLNAEPRGRWLEEARVRQAPYGSTAPVPRRDFEVTGHRAASSRVAPVFVACPIAVAPETAQGIDWDQFTPQALVEVGRHGPRVEHVAATAYRPTTLEP